MALCERPPEALVMMFFKESICHIEQGKYANNFSRTTDQKETSLGCARTCSNDDQCVGFSHQTRKSSSCILYNISPFFRIECETTNSSEGFMQKSGVCFHQGEWMEDTKQCSCHNTGGRVAKYCTSTPTLCVDYLMAGYTSVFGIIQMNPFGLPYRVPIDCYNYISRGYTDSLFVSFKPTSNAFNKSWDEFEYGFRENQNKWIGLSVMRYHLEASRDKRPIVHVRFDSESNPFLFAYHGFQLGDASEGYKMTYSHADLYAVYVTEREQGQIKECLREANGSRFSTFDHDADNDDQENCALLSGAGFWYDSCHPTCQPLALSFNQTVPRAFILSDFTSAQSPFFSDPFLWGGNFDKVTITMRVNKN